jgi:hypothetical protein
VRPDIPTRSAPIHARIRVGKPPENLLVFQKYFLAMANAQLDEQAARRAILNQLVKARDLTAQADAAGDLAARRSNAPLLAIDGSPAADCRSAGVAMPPVPIGRHEPTWGNLRTRASVSATSLAVAPPTWPRTFPQDGIFKALFVEIKKVIYFPVKRAYASVQKVIEC